MNRKTLHAFLLLVFLTSTLSAQTTNYQVYALFVVNIAKYSAWPTPSNTMTITVLGKSKVYDELAKQDGKTIGGITFKVSQTDDISSLGQPHIIFLADGKSAALDDLLKSIEGKPIMVIAEREGLYKKGAGFSFIIMENKTLRYDINNSELEKRRIKVSKNLSTLANVVI